MTRRRDDDAVITAPDRCTQYRASSIAPATPRIRHLLGVWAHPDDEAYLSAALMARTIEDGGRVTLVTLSDGEAGFPVDDVRPPADRARLRRRELRAAMARIGVTDIRFVGLSDGRVAEQGGDPLVETIKKLMIDLEPDVTVTFGPDGMTGHADHIHNSWAVTSAWANTGIGDLWYAGKSQAWLDEWRRMHENFGIWMTGEPPATSRTDAVLTIALDERELDQKRAVLAEHASQTSAVADAFGENDYRRWIAEETFRRPSVIELIEATAQTRRRDVTLADVA